MPDYDKIPFKNKDIKRINSSFETSTPRPYKARTRSGSEVSLRKQTVDSARAQTGAFKPMPAYKGRELKSGVKLNDGTFIRTTNPVDRKKALTKLEYDRRLHSRDSINQFSRTRRVANARKE